MTDEVRRVEASVYSELAVALQNSDAEFDPFAHYDLSRVHRGAAGPAVGDCDPHDHRDATSDVQTIGDHQEQRLVGT